MSQLQAVIFDLGGTLLEFPNEETAFRRAWGICYDHLVTVLADRAWPPRINFIQAMFQAETAHWRRVTEEQWSGPPSGLVRDGLSRLGRGVNEQEILVALDGYTHAIERWTAPVPDVHETLSLLRTRGYRLGLLSNTWWAAEWHHADLAVHGLASLLDEKVYTSDLPHSKPHASVFAEITARLGVEAEACIMVGDRMIDDVSGALGAGMAAAVWVKNDMPWPKPEHIVPTASISGLAELPLFLDAWTRQ
jgi:HAD superfamily hydrolase (TIGR01509 family)